MPPSRRAILGSSAALITGATGIGSQARIGASATGSRESRSALDATDSDVEEQAGTVEVSGTWSSYKSDAANSGYAADTTGPRETVQTMWSQSIDQRIFSSPSVVDGQVFVGTFDLEGHIGSIRSYDAATGELQWNVETGRVHTSAPAVADGTLYIMSGDSENGGKINALDTATGEIQWTDTFAETEQINSSPAVKNGVVYATAVTETDDADVLVRSYDAETGDRQWSVTVDAPRSPYGSPAVADGTVFVPTSKDCETARELYALDAETGETEWAVSTDVMTGAPTAVDGVLYHASVKHGVVAREMATGDVLWQAGRTVTPRFGPAVADGTVYATTEHPGSTYALDAATGTLQWEFDSGETRGSPVVDSSYVYIPSWGDERIYAVDAENGTEQWHYDLNAHPYQPPAVVGSTLFVGDGGTDGGTLYAVSGE